MRTCKIGWKNWQNQVRRKLQRECRFVLDMSKGADFACVLPNGKLKLVEVKCGDGSLTKTQRATRMTAEKTGIRYEVVRGE